MKKKQLFSIKQFSADRPRRVILSLAVCVVLMLAMSILVFADAGVEGDFTALYGTFWSLLPPILAIVLALITKEAYSSLFIGVVVGGFLVAEGSPVRALTAIIDGSYDVINKSMELDEATTGLIPSLADSAGIFIFLVLLGIIVCLVNLSGGSAAFGRWATKNIKTKVGAQIATFVLGVLIFIDDYFNCLTVGSVMRPVTDSHRISRAKLSYLIDATAAPVCMIAPVSSWATAVSGVAAKLNTGMSGIELFVRAIPYNFYSLLTFVFIIAIIVMKFDYGPMQMYEMAAQLNGDLGALEGSDEEKGNPNGRVLDMILPVVVLIVGSVLGMMYSGGFFGDDPEYAGNFINAFGDCDPYYGLVFGGIIGLVFSVIYMLCRRVITFKQAMECVPKGFVSMVPAMIILTLALTLNSMTNALGANQFVHNLMEGASQGLTNMLPAVIFVVAVILAFASGTSWGTFGILIPIVLSVFPSDSPLLFIGMSACLAGAVCGDHCSPISDTTIMASAGAQVQHINHVSTQLPYALTVAAISFVTYIFAGFIKNAIISLIIGVVLTIGTLFVIKKFFAGKGTKAPAK